MVETGGTGKRGEAQSKLPSKACHPCVTSSDTLHLRSFPYFLSGTNSWKPSLQAVVGFYIQTTTGSSFWIPAWPWPPQVFGQSSHWAPKSISVRVFPETGPGWIHSPVCSKGLIHAVTEICTLPSLQGEPEPQDSPQCSSGPKVGRLETEDKSTFKQESAGRKKNPDSHSEAGRWRQGRPYSCGCPMCPLFWSNWLDSTVIWLSKWCCGSPAGWRLLARYRHEDDLLWIRKVHCVAFLIAGVHGFRNWDY